MSEDLIRSQALDWGEDTPGTHVIEGMKHAILAYVFRMKHMNAAGNSSAMMRFYSLFNNYMSLVMWKVRQATGLSLNLMLMDVCSAVCHHLWALYCSIAASYRLHLTG